jgi:hypothetical protein
MELDLPDDLTTDMEVLFVTPYSQEQTDDVKYSADQNDALIQAYKTATMQDPEFQHFEDTVAVLKTMHGVGGYIVGADMILLYGDKDKLETIAASLKSSTNYSHFFETVGNFMQHMDGEDAKVVLPGPTLN